MSGFLVLSKKKKESLANDFLFLHSYISRKMKNIFKRTGLFIFLLSISTLISARTLSFENILKEIQSIQKQFVPDKRVAIFDISLKDTLQPEVVISGETNLPEGKKHLISFLEEKEIPFIDSIRVLPDSATGDKTWALTKLSVSNMRYLPDHTSELVSQVLMGTPMKVLDFKKGWYRIQTPDNYIGWMDAGGLQCITQSEIEQWKGSNRWIYTNISGYIYDSPGKNGEVVADLVLNDIFEVEGELKGFLKIIIPDGREGYVRKKECTSLKEWSSRQPDIKNLLSLPRKMMGAPYIWGGASVRGVDCSGFVKIAYFTQGIILARDASQQARYGEPIDFHKPENLKQGDLLFFGRDDKHIGHVGIYIGNNDFIHASGRVHISSIDPKDPKYVATRNNVAARRILNSLDTEGIVMVKNHPWYF